MVWKKNTPIETEIKAESPLDLSIFKKKSSAHSFQGFLIGKIKEARDKGNKELVFLLYELYKKYIGFRTQDEVILKSWKGKSGIQVINKPDYFIVITHQRPDQDSPVEEIKTEITKNEVNEIINVLNKLDDGNPIPTSKIAVEWQKRAWREVFSDRPIHIRLTLILGLLDYYGITIYRAGKSKVLNKIRIIQEHFR